MKWSQLSRALFFTTFFSSCGESPIGTYNGQPVEFHTGEAEDVEEPLEEATKLKAVNESDLAYYNEKLLEAEALLNFEAREVSKSNLTVSKSLLEKYENYDYRFTENCSEANGMGEYFYYKNKVVDLGGNPIFPYSKDYPETLDGFQKFLRELGVKHFSSRELSRGTEQHLRSCGLSNLMPPKNCWMRGAVLLLMAEKIRTAIGNFPLSVGSWYRPDCYNKELQKKNRNVASKSDHRLAKAIDLFYAGKIGKVNIRRKIQKFVCSNFWNNKNFTSGRFEDGSSPNVSIGMGNTVIHLGIDSPKGKRSWTYKSYPQSELPYAECFSS